MVGLTLIMNNTERLVLLLGLLALGILLCDSQNIRLIDNGYEGILVAISENIKYDPELLPKIMSVLNKASAVLYSATRYRAYFRNVTILVPSTWSVEASQATTEIFDKANVRVDIPSDQYGNNPWVKQTAGCGIPGEYMHLTPQFLINQADSEKIWGPLALKNNPSSSEKVVIHEWGHLRWGLFDEYPIGDSMKEYFYFSSTTSKVEASHCSLNVKGTFRNARTGSNCRIDPLTSLPEADCRFYPNPSATTTTSSIMYYHFLPSVSQFCDDNEYDPDNYHNIEAPSQHNRLCGGRSAWTIMRESVDFKNGANPGTDKPGLNTNITFNLVKRSQKKRVVVVMDTSGSMGHDNNYIKLAAAVKRYLLYTVQTGTSVGLVEYSDRAKKITNQLLKINSDVDRHTLANQITPKKGGNTATGQGLLAAQQLLSADKAGALAESRIVLLTDGEETETPFIKDVAPKILSAKTVVDTVLLTAQATAPALISLAANTSGLSFYSSGSSDSTSLSDAYTKAERDRITNSRLAPITILSSVVRIKSKETDCFNIRIDDTLGRDSTFIFTWSSIIAKLSISITAPNSTLFRPDTTKSQAVETGYRCEGMCPTGQWRICIKNEGNQPENVISQVESTVANTTGAEESTLPITVSTRIINKSPSFNDTEAQPVTVLATVAQGYSPVIGARVIAVLESPDSGDVAVKIPLRDDGATADVVKDDGTYSAVIFNTEKEGKHTLSVTVEGVDGQTNIKSSQHVSQAAIQTAPNSISTIPRTKLKPINNLQRKSLAGFIDVESTAPNDTDILPPARVIDLEVAQTSYENRSVTLTWTAVGDDVDKDKASAYRLWRSDNHTMLQRDYRSTTEVTSAEVIQGSLQIVSRPYEKEEVTIQLEDLETATVFGLVVTDDAGNESPISNVVAVKPFSVKETLLLSDDGSVVAERVTYLRGTTAKTVISSSIALVGNLGLLMVTSSLLSMWLHLLL